MVTVIQERHIMLDMDIGDGDSDTSRHKILKMEIGQCDIDTKTTYNARYEDR